MTTLQLKTDPARELMKRKTGIYVRALDSTGHMTSVDIAVLTKASLLAWLRSHGGSNEWAENVVCILLEHP